MGPGVDSKNQEDQRFKVVVLGSTSGVIEHGLFGKLLQKLHFVYGKIWKTGWWFQPL